MTSGVHLGNIDHFGGHTETGCLGMMMNWRLGFLTSFLRVEEQTCLAVDIFINRLSSWSCVHMHVVDMY